jgi:hypothetical protein
MTAELYMVIMKQIMRVVEQADTGYRSKLWLCNWIKKWMTDHDGQEPSSVPYECHGFDLSKMYPENLMYLPSQAGAGPDASFFHDHNDGRRESLDVLNWIEYNIINDTPEAEREYIPVEVVVEPRPEIPAHVRDPKLIRMYEAIQAQYDANAATQKAQRVAAALEIARYAGAEQGDNAFFHCGLALRNAGLSLDEVKAHLDNEARGAASPADRKSQNRRIIDWLRKNAGKTVMSI